MNDTQEDAVQAVAAAVSESGEAQPAPAPASTAPQLDALFRARPELRLALPYLGDANGVAQLAFAAITQQWVEAVYGIREAAVAASKLNWWIQELAGAREGHTHHPLAAALHAAPAARQLDEALWYAAMNAGMRLREATPPADFAAQLAQAEPFHAALAALENRLCCGSDAAARAGRLATLGHLQSSLLHLGEALVDNDGLPMRQLARHALERTRLGEASEARDQALRDQLVDLQKAAADAMSLPGPLSLARELTAAADRRQLRRALKTGTPLAALADVRGRLGPAQAVRAWRGGRRHQQRLQTTGEGIDT